MRVNSRSVRGGMREGGIVGRYRPSEMDFQQASYAYGDEAAKMPQLCTVVWGFGVTPVEGAELVSALICASSKGVTIREMKVGPSRQAVRFLPQTAASCCRQERWWGALQLTSRGYPGG